MLGQVVDIDHKVLVSTKKINATLRRLAEAKKFIQVVQPFDTARMFFECMHKACQGSQFNRVREFQEEFFQKLEADYLTFQDIDAEQQQWFPDTYSKPDLPEK